MSQFMNKVILLCVLMLLSMHNIHAVRVNIVNSLEGNLDLTVHCKSGDDDLGKHVLRHGQSYGFNFGTKIFGSTLFFCGFTWSGQLHYFDIFKSKDSRTSDCITCDWKILKAGPCRVYGSRLECFPWNK